MQRTYITILDSDDIAVSNRLKIQINSFLNDENVYLISSDDCLINENKIIIKKKLKKKAKSRNLILIILLPTLQLCFKKN